MTITYERIPAPGCARPRGASCPQTMTSPFDRQMTRMHSVTLAKWENDGRRVCVEIEATAKVVDGVERVQSPGINLYVGETGADDLTAEQARTLAAFVSVSLNRAADRVEEIIQAGDAAPPA
jgi:hypothetical protein